jgi:hypothetical protein
LFFFEKKKKLLSRFLGAGSAVGTAQWIKVFLLLFLQKKKSLPELPLTAWPPHVP